MDERSVRVHAGKVVLQGDLGVPEGRQRRRAVRPRLRQRAAQLPQSLRRRAVIPARSTWRRCLWTCSPRRRSTRGRTVHRPPAVRHWDARRPAGSRHRLAVPGAVPTRSLGVGYFGESTGGGAALVAATRTAPERVRAVVSRGGRPDLAGDALPAVRAPTLLIVGGRRRAGDRPERAGTRRDSGAEVKQLVIVPRARRTYFEETGTLAQVAGLAGGLVQPPPPRLIRLEGRQLR